MTEPTTPERAGAVLESDVLAWDVPEIAAVAVLSAFSVTAVGGLVTGIDVMASRQPPFIDPMESVWNSIQFGTSWAVPLLAIVLLGVVGLCWWQAGAWTDEQGEWDQDSSAASRHVGRARRIAVWALAALIITLIGAIAGLVAVIGFNIPAHPGQLVWSRAIGASASTVATTAVVVAGALVFNRLVDPRRRPPGSAELR